MKVRDIIDSNGNLFAFEVNQSCFFGRYSVARVLKTIPGIIMHKTPRFIISCFWQEVFCKFELAGKLFEVWEPYGDNTTYWIGPIALKDKLPNAEIHIIREAFLRY